MTEPNATSDKDGFDYIIVGSGAGGAPLAARLVEAGKRVLVLEAGPSFEKRTATDPAHELTNVPGLHAVSTEHPDISWQYFVEHYAKDSAGNLPDNLASDSKRHLAPASDPLADQRTGIFYPRATGIGGCTIHNAMITIAGPDADWDELSEFLGDPSWRGARMRGYFQKMERNEYLPEPSMKRLPFIRAILLYCLTALRWVFQFLPWIGRRPDPTAGRHGFKGWLHTSTADLSLGLGDVQLKTMLSAALKQARAAGLDRASTLVRRFLHGRITETLDPNHYETQEHSPEGVVLIPVAVNGRDSNSTKSGPAAECGHRSSPREWLLWVRSQHPQLLVIETDCLVTNVILSSQAPHRAEGVKFQRGAKLYRACVDPAKSEGTTDERRVKSGGEVILCGGAFNTPQLLMLSGIGPKQKNGMIGVDGSDRGRPAWHETVSGTQAEAESFDDGEIEETAIQIQPGEELWSSNIPCRVSLPGVGRNLHDRYEVSVVSEMKQDFALLKDATFSVPAAGGLDSRVRGIDGARGNDGVPDEALKSWRLNGKGLYASNGAVLGIFKRSRPNLEQPDLFIFGVPLEFRGYKVGYSQVQRHDQFSWVILKLHTRNHDGIVRLRSNDPRDTPVINFHSFRTRSSRNDRKLGSDIRALAEGVKFVRGILSHAKAVVKTETSPGLTVVPEDDNQALQKWIRQEAWGHHACGTCRMGPAGDALAVLDSRFRVRDVAGLRVVDASIFPKIPGYFIATNIYMASEKAADVILEDAGDRSSGTPSVYPEELANAEIAAMDLRRSLLPQNRRPLATSVSAAHAAPVAVACAGAEQGDDPGKPGEERDKGIVGAEGQQSQTLFGRWSGDVTGLALSGGGVRSATVCLGVLQSFARGGWLRRFDMLSTVSGGGYIGGFFGRCFDRLRRDGRGPITTTNAVEAVENALLDNNSAELSWLRKHGNYLAPQGAGDGRLNFAVFVRNLLSVHLVVGLALFTLFGLANGLRYSVLDRFMAAVGLVFDCGDLPIGYLVSSLFGPFFSPWFLLVEFLILFMIVPRIAGYWIVSQDVHQSFKRVPLTVMVVIASGLLILGVKDGLKLEMVVMGLSLLSSLIHVEMAWRRGDKREAAVGTGSVETQRARTRNYLTYDLGMSLALTGTAVVFVLIDTVGHGIQQWKLSDNQAYAKSFAAIMGTIMAAMPVARYLTGLITQPTAGPPSTMVRVLKQGLISGGMAVVLFTLPMVFYSFAAHAAFGGGSTERLGWLITLATLMTTAAFALPTAVSFVNRSSLAQTYAARLARAYLGASNPFRRRPDGANVTEVIPGDDVASVCDYRPHAAGGPLHLINLTLNQTVDRESQLAKRDRCGEILTVSCLGMTVGENCHSLWKEVRQPGPLNGRKRPLGLEPVGWSPGERHPLVDQWGRGAQQAEMLSLRQWIALSGAAIDTGRGRGTQLGTALLMGLVNMRTGYWWDSGIAHADRYGWPDLTFTRRLLYLVPRFFATQCLVLYEWFARFPGPSERFWHLSDGGFFENLGGYELIRRRIPRIIICDCGADPDYQFEDLAELTRKVRIDFGALIEPFTATQLKAIVPALPSAIGTLDELVPGAAANGQPAKSLKHATLLSVSYADAPGQRSLILFLKATVSGDESLDVRNYHIGHPEFPHEATADQFFDEPQWESYRKLGQHIGEEVQGTLDWFWKL